MSALEECVAGEADGDFGLRSKIRAPFTSLTLSTTEYTAVLDALTPETYILVLSRGNIRASPSRSLSSPHSLPTPSLPPSLLTLPCILLTFYSAEPAAIELNIRLARPHFGKLEAIGMSK